MHLMSAVSPTVTVTAIAAAVVVVAVALVAAQVVQTKCSFKGKGRIRLRRVRSKAGLWQHFAKRLVDCGLSETKRSAFFSLELGSGLG